MCHSEQRDAMTSLFSGASSGHPLTSTDSGSRLTLLAVLWYNFRCGVRGVRDSEVCAVWPCGGDGCV